MIEQTLPDGHVWLRIVQPHYRDPFDPSFALRRGGRWNPPASWPTLYLNEDMATVHAQVRHLFLGRGIEPDDLDDDAPLLLAAATLPRRQVAADAISDDGLVALDLPTTYPVDDDGEPIPHAVTQRAGAQVHDAGVRGVWCRSAAVQGHGHGAGHELAWFPSARGRAHPVWDAPAPYGRWRRAGTLADVEPATR